MFVSDCSSKLQKNQRKLGYSSKATKTNQIKKKEILIQAEKENKPPKEQLMNRRGSSKPSTVLEKHSSQQSLSNVDDSFQVSFDMTNIAIRKNRVKGKRKQTTSLQHSNGNILNTSNEKIQLEKLTCQNNKDLPSENVPFQKLRSRNSFGSEVSGCRKSDDGLTQQVKRKSTELSRFSLTSLGSTDIIESSVIKDESISDSNKGVKISHTDKLNKRRRSSRISGLSDTTLSTAYDSDSITKTCKNKVKVIQETPETDNSFDASLKKKNVPVFSEIVLETPETDESLSFSIKERKKNSSNIPFQKEKSTSRLKGNVSWGIEKNTSIDKDHNDLFQEEINITSSNNTAKTSEWQNKKLRSNGESSLTDMFKLESSIKQQSSSINLKEMSDPTKNAICSSKEDRKLSISPILKEINTRNSGSKKIKSHELKGSNSKKLKNDELEAEKTCRSIVQVFDKSKKKIGKSTKRNFNISLTNENISKSPLVLPTEVIPKSDHVRNWLKNTQESSVISISSESSFSSPSATGITLIGGKVKKPFSLSPRIKKQMKIAKNTLNQEQQIFEDLYGQEMVER